MTMPTDDAQTSPPAHDSPTPPPPHTARALARVEAARARADAATPGPWEGTSNQVHAGNWWLFEAPRSWGTVDEAANCDFIAHARADVPLLATIAAAAVEYRAAEVAMEEESATVDADHRYYAARDALDAAIRAAGEAGNA